MAKLKGPLFSLGASQQLGKALVYFNWKGLDVVREYVVPSNPNTTLQKAQRAHLTSAVKAVHTAMAFAANPLVEADTMAYGLWASVVQSATTWFNQVVRHCIDRLVLALSYTIFRGGAFSAIGAAGFTFKVYSGQVAALPHLATGQFKWGTSKTALINIKAATPNYVTGEMSATWATLTTKTKYYVQFDGLTGPLYLAVKSGIYHVTTT